jgi:hypothetical protein
MSYEAVVKQLLLSAVLAGTIGATAAQDAIKQLNDAPRKRAYALVIDGLEVRDAGTRRKLALVPLPRWTWADEAYSCPPDIALTPDGDVLVTSNVVPVIWRINWRTLTATVHPLSLDADEDKDIGFVRLRWSPDLRAYVATTELGSDWHVDPGLTAARKASPGSAARRCGGGSG